MTGNLAAAGIYMLQTLLGLYLLVVVMRLLIQAVRADFYNPISQGLVRATDPLLRPLRRLVPRMRRFDLAALLLALAIEMILITGVMLLGGAPVPGPLLQVLWALVGIASMVLDIYYFALIAMVIVSWIAPFSRHPAITLIHQLVEPVCSPARRLLPPMGGIDFSIILVFMVITLLDRFLLIGPLQMMLGIPSGIMFGL